MDPAETLRHALTRQYQARRAYEKARRRELPDESPEQWSERVNDLRAAVEAADEEMARLRPPTPGAEDPTEERYVPPMGPETSN